MGERVLRDNGKCANCQFVHFCTAHFHIGLSSLVCCCGCPLENLFGVMSTTSMLLSTLESSPLLVGSVTVCFVSSILFYVFLLRPRTGGKNAPPTVTSSPVVPLPFIGVLGEFFKSPNTMVKRCCQDIGSVFTIPVRCLCRKDTSISTVSTDVDQDLSPTLDVIVVYRFFINV